MQDKVGLSDLSDQLHVPAIASYFTRWLRSGQPNWDGKPRRFISPIVQLSDIVFKHLDFI